MDKIDNVKNLWRISAVVWGLFGLLAVLAGFIFSEGIMFALHQWEQPEYGYAYFVPVLVAFFFWQRKDQLESLEFNGSWFGVVVLLLGVMVFWLGELSALHIFIQYALLIVIAGLIWSFLGNQAFKLVAVPLLVLFFAVPLPGFLYQSLSGELQLVSSQIGVAVIRLFGISVHLEGNVIDLGTYQLQVVEACSGLRYLFPLVTLGFIAAYFFKVEFWKRAIVFLSTVPITVLMNSFRIGVIGVLVEYWGPSMAEGFLHDFEGWIVFMACISVLVLEMWVLSRIGNDPRPLREVFGLDFPEPSPSDVSVRIRKIPASLYGGAGILAVVAVATLIAPERAEVLPDRKSFAEFPVVLADWQGNRDQFDQAVIESLNFDDYLYADYVSRTNGVPVNLYIGYYGIQRADKVPHSPKACLPGGGWLITSSDKVLANAVKIDGAPLLVNRVVIEKSGYKQLVYYWFQQRGRILVSEYAVKLFLLVDAIKKQRTDGALVRLTTIIQPGEEITAADERLTAFAAQLGSLLPQFVPN